MAKMPDLPDYTKQVGISVDLPENQKTISRPTGGLYDDGTITTTSEYQTIATITPQNGYKFQVSKIVISCVKAIWFKLQWNGEDVTHERCMDDKTIVIEHFPWESFNCEGDGVKTFTIQAKYFSAAGVCNAEIYGEEYEIQEE